MLRLKVELNPINLNAEYTERAQEVKQLKHIQTYFQKSPSINRA